MSQPGEAPVRGDFGLLWLVFIPLFLAIAAASMYGMIAPIHAGLNNYDYDPAYMYLLNGAGLVQGYAPAQVDHPGTPLQVLVGVVVYVTWLAAKFTGQAPPVFDAAILADPEHYIGVVSIVLLFMNAAAICYLGIRIREATGSVGSALIAQAGFAVLDSMIPRLVYLSPEALLIFAAVMALACLSNVLLQNPPPEHSGVRTGIATGFFIALGLTTKVTFLPLILLLAVLPTMRGKVAGVLSLMIFTMLLLLPIVTKLPWVVRSIMQVAQHTGLYGTGAPGFIDIAALPSRFFLLVRETPLLFVAGAACLLVAASHAAGFGYARSRALRFRIVWMGLVLVAIFAAQLLIVLKHFSLRDILPALSISSVALVWALIHWGPPADRIGMAAKSVAVALLLLAGLKQVHSNLHKLGQEKRERDSDLALMQQTFHAHRDAIVIGSYRARGQHYAIPFGMVYISKAYSLRLSRWGQHYSYNHGVGVINRPGGGVSPLHYLNELIAEGREVLMVLPEDVRIPNLQAEVLLQIPGKERIVKVIHVGAMIGARGALKLYGAGVQPRFDGGCKAVGHNRARHPEEAA